jgi:predicted transcriptional regulator
MTESPSSSRERVNALLGRLYRLNRDVSEYDSMHQAEIERLAERRRRAVGPIEHRIRRIERAVQDFAVAAWLDFGEKGLLVPNGEIASRPVKDSLVKDDAKIAAWFAGFVPDAVEHRPWVDTKKLRDFLEQRVVAGHLNRMVFKAAEDPADVEFDLVDEEEGWTRPFPDGWEGVWFWTTPGVEWAEQLGIHAMDGVILDGVRWEPNGALGSGRNFKVKL